MTQKIFLSYRRDDEPGFARALHTDLTAQLPDADIFKDVADSIKPGDNFRDVIERFVISSDIVLVLIGPKWTRILDEKRNADADYVELETRLALQLDKRVIPVLVNHAMPPARRDLPESLSELADLNTFEIRPDKFDVDTAALIRHLRPAPPDTPPGTETPDNATLGRKMIYVALAAIIGASIWTALAGEPPWQTVARMLPTSRTHSDCLNAANGTMVEIIQCHLDYDKL